MIYYAQIENNKCVGVSQLNEVVEDNSLMILENYDTRLLNCDYINGNFEGYYTKLSTDKNTILSDGIDKAIIVAEVYNYLDEQQLEFTGEVVFELDGEQIIKQAVDGIATIEFSTSLVGEYMIKSNINNYRTSELKVVAQ